MMNNNTENNAEPAKYYGLLHRQQNDEQDECCHDEHDHGICLDCGADVLDRLIMRAEDAADSLMDR